MSFVSKTKDSLKGALYFTVLGPPLGALAICLYLFFGSLFAGGSIDTAIFGGLTMGLFFAMGSYLPGIVPAALTGLVCGPFRRHLKLWRYCLVAAIAGALIATVFSFVIISRQQSDNPFLFFALPGFFASLLVSRFFGMRAPNDLFKPDPLRGSA